MFSLLLFFFFSIVRPSIHPFIHPSTTTTTIRYWAVTDIDYAHQRTAQRIGIMIVILWILSFLVSIAPMFGWKDPEWDKRLENYECLVSQDVSYQIFATMSSFYVPLLAILFLYWRIFLVARKRIRRRQQVSKQQTIVHLLPSFHFYFHFLCFFSASPTATFDT